MIRITELDDDGNVLYVVEGRLCAIIVPLLSRVENIDAVVADAKALKDGKLMPSVAKVLEKIPPRGTLDDGILDDTS